MSFVVTLIALLIERFFDWSHIRQWNWFLSLQNYVTERLQGKNSALILFISIAPLAIILWLLNIALYNVLYGFAKLVFDLVVLLYCFGPRNLWADIFSSTSELNSADSTRQKVANIFVAANVRVLAVIFWYLIAGIVGAFIYRTLAITSSKQNTSPNVVNNATYATAILDWLPVRFFTLLFAIGGRFSQVFACWRRKVPNGIYANNEILTECGLIAIGVDDTQPFPLDASALQKSAVNLLDRSLVILLVIVAVLILLSY